ncbi:S phase cyclin A-associated protein in the endoplasmic reticulum isoform X1 [Canis lupus dingo]|uniref:S phase cyclin A-associated protein in the endoplasmic reticulum isoform X1 n=1 Tax=Canis lupus dingo TaxID=286419 RepID=UPI000DC6C88D|nr:S phase cyclin A-associated protein in the endoplasmic reticulum isoform X1 [Canis lupus dingo]XP_025327866.1 S phase cyclin A-associated protein in the endoplasmic reticulum isoform X1 [Canis lupus dingo]XP_035564506.1 S phase cyclin A-associated protein in the endoplasmic reticulum isoform X1 [Canis lupus dingo]XP_038299004.1 S phase cyclin A-associated protein in the endoplasmic reticulum isoform X2 [Canis lupus familiaris]XP_038299005.1 S phase cyclin A-associated protein in the endoplas
MMASFQRSNSHDKVRRIVAEEGRTARNLIAWSVPLESKDDDGKSKCQTGGKSKRTIQGTHKNTKQNTAVDCKITSSTTGDKHFDKSPTKTRHPRKIDLRARYWAFLFDNLRRAVDEIYETCESDQSVVECKEVLMMLDNYVRDFKALIDWIQLQEKLEKTDAQSRPTSLAWEVKKMSPGRHVIPSPSTDRISVTSNARRSLNFGSSSGTVTAPRLAHTGVSWADKVKAHHTGSPAASDVASAQSCPPMTVQKTSRKNERKDAEGWETVQRGRPVRSRSTAVMTKVSVATETLKSKDDSDKENIRLLPDESIQKGEFAGDGSSKTTESRSKDSLQSFDHPLAERTQFTVSTLDDVKNSGSSTLQDSSVGTSEIPGVHIDTECVSVTQQADTPPSQANDVLSSEKAGIESEMDPSDISNVSAANLSMAEVLAKKEELADRLEKANEEAIASAIAEEEQLTREIEAEENNDINIETDNDSDFSASMGSGSVSFCGMSMDWNDVLADYEARETWRQNTSWGDIVEEEPARPPGHGIHMHEKLSSPSRKRTIAESKKKHEEKQMKAQQLREKLREEKTLKLQKLLEREKDVRKWKEELLDQRRRMMEEKLLHAEFKREVQLQAIVKKAQEEEAKVNEIAFINTLEAQNKRHDVLSKLKEYEQRLNELQEERQRRQEEKQARDEAVQERKRALEAERQARVEELLMKRKEQEARIEQQRQEKEKAREDAARERARDREERLAALTAAQQEAMEELQKKIQLKHDESIRRHMEQIEQRKEKAAELSSGRHANTDYAPKLTPYERKKQCSLCNVLISSEVYLFSHIKGKKHQQAVRENSSIQGRELSDEEVEHLSLKKYIIDVVVESAALPESLKDGEERQKNKKKAKKIKARMNSRAKEYESLTETKNSGSDSPYKAKLQRLAKDLLKQLQVQDSGSWANSKVSALDRTLGEIARILEKKNVADQIAFQVAGGLTALEHILQVVVPTTNVNTASRIPPKCLCNAINVYNLTCNNCSENCTDVLFSNKITFLMDLLIHQLTVYVPDENNAILGRNTNKQVFEGLTTGLLKVSAVVFSCLIANRPDGSSRPATPKISTQEMKNKPSQGDAFNSRVQDLISYVVNIGLINKLHGCFLSVQGPVDENPKMATFLQHAAELLHGMCTLCFAVTRRSCGIFDSNRQDPTGLTAALQATDLAGVLHMLYCVLLHGTVSDPGTASPKDTYTPNTVRVAVQSLQFFNSFAALDLPAFQSIVGAEGLSLAFRHIASSLLGHCSQASCESLLHEVIVCVGYFTVNHPDNQVVVQSGRHPTVLQKLCQLPFQYFSEPRLTKVLFPSLLAACFNNRHNRTILEQEMSCVLLATFVQDFVQTPGQADTRAHQPKGKSLGSQDYLELANRFPQEAWEEARQFFLKKDNK